MSFFNALGWTAGSKVTGIGRDASLLLILGLTEKTDLVFLGATTVMFWQLVSYQAGLTYFMGKNISTSLFSLKTVMPIGLATVVISFVYMFSGLDWEIVRTTVFFLISAPISVLLGLVASICVLRGRATALAEVTVVQNCCLLIVFLTVFVLAEADAAILAWPLSLLFAAGYGVFVLSKIPSDGLAIAGDLPSVSKRNALLIPLFSFATVLAERTFYVRLEGALAIVKILETVATSIATFTQVVFYNRALNRLNQTDQIDGGATAAGTLSILRLSLIRSVGLGVVLYFGVIGVGVYLLPLLGDRVSIPASIEGVVFVLAMTYSLFLVGWIAREHVERFAILQNNVQRVIYSGIAVFVLCIALNYTFKGFVPLSVLWIGIVLTAAKIVFLFRTSLEVSGDK